MSLDKFIRSQTKKGLKALKNKDYFVALSILGPTYELKRDNVDCIYALIYTNLITENPEKALEYYGKTKDLSLNNLRFKRKTKNLLINSLSGLSDYLIGKGDFESAIKALNDALNHDDENTELLNKRGRAKEGFKDYMGAIDDFRTASLLIAEDVTYAVPAGFMTGIRTNMVLLDLIREAREAYDIKSAINKYFNQ